MSRQQCIAFWGLALLAGLAAGGCSKAAPRMVAPTFSPGSAASAAMTQYDKNGDGKVDAKEMSAGLKFVLKEGDTNTDGALDQSEIAARVKVYGEGKLAMLEMPCEVSLDGKPLSGATITFIPEEFLGAAIKPASGTSDNEGFVLLKADGQSNPGIFPGLFRIEVSKKDASGKETLPAKYNTATELAQEVAFGLPSLQGGFKCPLISK